MSPKRRLAQVVSAVGLTILAGCDRLAGGEHGRLGTLRHGAGLDLASWLSLTFAGLAVAGGIAWMVEDRWRRRPNPSRTVWGGFLVVLGVFVLLRVPDDFRYLWNCC